MSVDEANPDIVEWLRERGSLLAAGKITHTYPHCWRCKQPVIFRATDQWFVSMDATHLREAALREIEQRRVGPGLVDQPHPAMVADRPDWCICRQRAWGVPIPVFDCAKCGETVATPETFAAVERAVRDRRRRRLVHEAAERVPARRAPRARAAAAPSSSRRPTSSTSGSSRACRTRACSRRAPSCSARPTIYLEGTDQHRGWFQSLAADERGRLRRARRSRPCSRTASSSTATAARCPSRSATSISPLDVDREVRRRHHAPVGGRDRLRPGRPRLRRDPRSHERGLPPHPQHVPLPALQPLRLRPGDRLGGVGRDARARPLRAGAARRVARSRDEAPTTSGASTRSTTRSTTTAASCPRSTSTCSRTASTPTRAASRCPVAARRRCSRRCSACSCACSRRSCRSPARRCGSSCPSRCAMPRACSSSEWPTVDVPAEEAAELRDAYGVVLEVREIGHQGARGRSQREGDRQEPGGRGHAGRACRRARGAGGAWHRARWPSCSSSPRSTWRRATNSR